MRQVVRDRLARILMQRDEYTRMYNDSKQEEDDAMLDGRRLYFRKAGAEALFDKINALNELYNQIIDKELSSATSVRQSVYDKGLDDKLFNYNSAIEEREFIVNRFAELSMEPDKSRAQHLELCRQAKKIAECNRLIAIYKKSLEHWRKKKVIPDAKPEYRADDIAIMREAHAVRDAPQGDPEILAILAELERKKLTTLAGATFVPKDTETVAIIPPRDFVAEYKAGQDSEADSDEDVQFDD